MGEHVHNNARPGGAMDEVPPLWNRYTDAAIGAAMDVHTVLGPGLLEKLYEEALVCELESRGVPFKRQVSIGVDYKGRRIGEQVLDVVIGDVLVLELKAIERVNDIHLAQLVSYMRVTRMPLGLLINFNVPHLKQGIYRRVNTDPRQRLPDSFSNPPSPPRSSASSAFKV
ncbi:MAG: GxxExxY protein [Phycisphaeraceae bacterium]|nr:GxxExxY protein [Phycisphaeraceae bacterium]